MAQPVDAGYSGRMVDPFAALVKFQEAVDRGIRMERGRLHSELSVVYDEPRGKSRFTYAKVVNGKVLAVALFANTKPVDGVTCFQAGIAVVEDMRCKGLATEVLSKGIEELRNGLMPLGAKQFYIEAVVSTLNAPSNRVATRVLSEAPTSCTDGPSGEPALHYLKLIT